MSTHKVYRAIGLMSGTSLDGIDAALIETDGYGHVKPLEFVSVPYSAAQRESIRAAFGARERGGAVEALVTQAHIDVLRDAGWRADVIGFHGQTVFHAPDDGITVQLGDGAAMASALGVTVVNDFRSADIAAGGQGAPLAPIYHHARVVSSDVALPCAVLNIGGVANVTWIGGDCLPREGGDFLSSGQKVPVCTRTAQAFGLLAFDTGPGNALMDDWAQMRRGMAYDDGGALAAAGQAQEAPIQDWLAHDYFAAIPPKSLDRDAWALDGLKGLSDEDGAATLLEFTARSIVQSQAFMPEPPNRWYVCGGGRHNAALMARLSRDLNVQPVEALGWNGDAVEAECFAYLAVRSLLGEPISFPSTTDVAQALCGGVLCRHG